MSRQMADAHRVLHVDDALPKTLSDKLLDQKKEEGVRLLRRRKKSGHGIVEAQLRFPPAGHEFR